MSDHIRASWENASAVDLCWFMTLLTKRHMQCWYSLCPDFERFHWVIQAKMNLMIFWLLLGTSMSVGLCPPRLMAACLYIQPSDFNDESLKSVSGISWVSIFFFPKMHINETTKTGITLFCLMLRWRKRLCFLQIYSKKVGKYGLCFSQIHSEKVDKRHCS